MATRSRSGWPLLAATLIGGVGPSARAQERLALSLATTVDTTRAMAAMNTLEFTLNRPLLADEGELVMTVGGVDVTAFAERAGQRFVYRPTFVPLPAGTTDVIVYVKTGARWTELRRVTLTVMTASGFKRVSTTPSVTMGLKGQLAEGRSEGMPEPARPQYQDFVMNGSLQTAHERSRFTIETSSAVVGASRREEALRFGQLQDSAPRLDLSDYRVVLRAGSSSLTLGNTTFGASRHLISNFGARGAALGWSSGGSELSLGALSAAPIVGWSNIVGMKNPDHRMFGASVGREFIPRRPGAIKLEATLMEASMLPLGGFRQGAVLDAEQSTGGALQLAMSTPGQRMRFSGGVSRSRFANPPLDPELTGDTIVRAVASETRRAQFVEANVTVLQNRLVRRLGATNLAIAYRHERVDPLYRSVAAPVQADRLHNGIDATFGLGVVSGQASGSWSRDNLGHISTILTTLGQSTSGSVALPLAQLFRVTRASSAWPAVMMSLNTVRQVAEATPEGGTFRPQDVPDQVTVNREIGAQWQVSAWRVAVRHNRADQDNRQSGRELADFTSGSDAVSIGTSLGASSDLSLDVGRDFQESHERRERTDTKRITLNGSIRRGRGTSLMIALSLLQTDPPSGPTTLNSEQRVEVMQALSFLRTASGGARAQVFVRFGRTTARIPDFALIANDPMAQLTQRQWAFASGLNVRMF